MSFRLWRRCAGAMLLAGMACAAGAQQVMTMQAPPPAPQSSAPMATVTGHVTCSDTQKPARFANVWLISAEEASGAQGQMNFGRRAGGRTDLNGDFTLQTGPGDYYVSATASGYISPVAEAAARLGSNASPSDLLASLPEVHVSNTGGGPVNITLDRGGVIAGKLQWEDGSPASGVNVVAVSNASTSGSSGEMTVNRTMARLGGFNSGGFQMSDDRGNFRLTGLAPGSYVVRASLMTPSAEPSRGFGQRMAMVTMYAPGKVRRSDAQTLTLKAGEERDDVAFTLDLTQMHTVSGHVSSDGSGTIESGTVRLTDASDTTLTRSAQIQSDGSFVVQWVPSGNYTLSVSNASTQPRNFGGFGSFDGSRGAGSSSGSAQTFQPFQQSLTVTDADMTGVAVSLSPTNSQ